MKETIHRFAPGDVDGYDRFLSLSARLHDISEKFYFWRSVGGLRDVFDWKNSFSIKTLGDVRAMRMGSTVARTVRSFVKDPRLAQMLDHFTQYVGSSPEASPAVLCSIAHMQTAGGVWYPRGGTRAIPNALAHLANDLGVELHCETAVRRIAHDRRRVSGIELGDGSIESFDAVVSNMDVVRTYRDLIGDASIVQRFERRRHYEPACSGIVLYLGLDRAYNHLAHHNFVFSADPHAEFDAIYRRGELAADPTCYVAAPSRTEAEVAPPGGEALYVLVHTPYLRPGHDWAKMLADYRRVIFKKLATTGGMPDLERRIRFESCLTPQDIHDRYRVLNGAIYGLASHGRWLGAFKPGNRSPDVKGLYFAGGSAHPGAGMPMALMSGWIAADSLDQDAGTHSASQPVSREEVPQ
jgi:phytoene desaturase